MADYSGVKRIVQLSSWYCYSGNGVAHINEVTLRGARLVLRWMTACRYTTLIFNQPIRPTQPGHLSMGLEQ